MLGIHVACCSISNTSYVVHLGGLNKITELRLKSVGEREQKREGKTCSQPKDEAVWSTSVVRG